MKYPSLFLLIVFMALLLLGFGDKVYSADAPVVSTVYAQQSDPNGISVKDVYDALIQTKDDKALIYEKVIDWLLATIGVVTGISGIIAAAVIFWFQRQNDKLDKRINDINLNIRELQIRETNISNELQIRETNISNAQAAIVKTQEEIDLFIKSSDFKQRIIELESNLSKIDSVEKQWNDKLQFLLIAEAEQKEKIYSALKRTWSKQVNRLRTDEIDILAYPQPEIDYETIANSLKEPYKNIFLEIQESFEFMEKNGTILFDKVTLDHLGDIYSKIEQFENAVLERILL
jgi:nitrate reductase NapAB chaperone NapD